MWNSKKYNDILDGFKKRGEFLGKPVKSKEKIYELLGEYMSVSRHTTKKWASSDSNGPCENDLEKLKELFGTEFTVSEKEESMTRKIVEEELEEHTMYSDFVKNNIKAAYELIADYYVKNFFLEEDLYVDMWMRLKLLRIGIPSHVFEKIEKYISEKLKPMVFDKENYWADTYDETMGEFDADHEFHFIDEVARTRQFVLRMEKFFEGQEELEEFAMREFYPILVN